MGKAAKRAVVNTSEEDEENPSITRVRSGKKSRKNKSSKMKKGSVINKAVVRFVPNMIQLTAEFKADPVKTGKRIAWKTITYIWVLIVVFSLLKLMGFDLSFANSTGVVGERRLLGEMIPNLAINSDQLEGTNVAENDEDEDATGEAEDAVPEMANYEVKKPNKINRAREKELACKQVDCQERCGKKIAAKCAAKKSCRAEREKICKRRCAKERCEERCKDEPKYGYVEREQKMDKCKEGCQGSTAQHNKCIKKCHSEFKPCKSRCHEIFNKFQCDEPKQDLTPLIADVEEKVSSSSSSISSVQDSSSGLSSGGDDLDDEVI